MKTRKERAKAEAEIEALIPEPVAPGKGSNKAGGKKLKTKAQTRGQAQAQAQAKTKVDAQVQANAHTLTNFKAKAKTQTKARAPAPLVNESLRRAESEPNPKSSTKAAKHRKMAASEPPETKLKTLQAIIGYKFNSPTLGLQAIQAAQKVKPLQYSGKTYQVPHNKRLAIVGDACLSLLLTGE
jgi:hypothetical protein